MSCESPNAAPVRAIALSVAGSTGVVSSEEVAHFDAILRETLARAAIDVVPSGAPAAGVSGEVQVYWPGSRVARAFGWPVNLAWLGAGKFESQWRFTDESAADTDRCTVTGAITWGFLGGSYDGVLDEASWRLAEYLLAAPQYSEPCNRCD